MLVVVNIISTYEMNINMIQCPVSSLILTLKSFFGKELMRGRIFIQVEFAMV